jgi:DNA repair exonuclease SbcCD ATPase subunit
MSQRIEALREKAARRGKIDHEEGARYQTADWNDVLFLLAEIQRLRDDKEGLSAICTKWEMEYAKLRAENQQLRDALERIAEAAESWELPPRGVIWTAKVARTALAGTPSEDAECPRCKGSGIVASVDGEAMDCDCGTPSEDT